MASSEHALLDITSTSLMLPRKEVRAPAQRLILILPVDEQ